MNNKNTDSIYQQLQQQLRATAETQLEHTEFSESTQSASELLHELRVHQIELEMQNEELRHAQCALSESRDRYVDLYEFAPVGYLTLTLEGIIEEINLTAATLLGVPRTKLLNSRFASYISSENRGYWYRHFLQLTQQNIKQACELTLCRADGTQLHTHIDCMLKEVTDALPVLRLTITDITTRKQTEDELRISEARFASIVEGAELATWDWNIQTGDILFNQRWAQMRGYALNEFEPHIDFWQQGIFPEDLARVQNAFTEHFSGYTPFFTAEYRVSTKSGAWIWIMARGKVIQWDADEKPLRITGVTMNINQRKLAEEHLRIAATALETQAGIIITDTTQRIMCVNQAFTDITGYAEQDAIGQTPFFLRSGLHDKQFYKRIGASLTRDGCWQGEVWDRHKNGRIIPIWLSITTVMDTNDLLTYYVGSFTDITVQKQAEKVLLDAREHLKNQVVSTQEELEKSKEDAANINAALHVLLKHRETDKNDAQSILSREVQGTVLPFLKRLKKANSDGNQSRLIDVLETNLQHLVQFYGRDTSLASVYQRLTPTEIQVASMIRQGLSTKLIAATLNLSQGTISIHRKHIRKKLDLDSKEINLYGYMMSLTE